MIITFINLKLDKTQNCVILAVYKQLLKATRLSARSIFKMDVQQFPVYNLTTIYRSYLLLGTYLHKTTASYKIPTSLRSI
jgi:Fe2+ or Zn2+ uptake regulation protein